ncbi:MAG: hypothetical protein IPP73_15630 [Chitinophagaceae bacterium]|nr:hypothetical protein [Chitinophagaceae bacterium]
MRGVIRQIIYFCLLALLLPACSKSGSGGNGNNDPHEINYNDVTAPVVEINSPVAGELFLSGNSIVVTGKITDTQGLYRGHIKVTSDANGAVLKDQAYDIHGLLLYNYNLSYLVNTATAGTYTVSVAFEDHGLNMTTKTVKVSVGP